MGKGTEVDIEGDGSRHRPIVLIDIDHTLSDATWRDPMIGTTSWDEYHAASANDKPHEDVARLVRYLCASNNYLCVGLTTRPEKWRRLTMDWLLSNSIFLDRLHMRPDDDFRPAPQVKVETAHALGLEEIAFILEDREDVVTAFKAVGITALQVHARRGS